MDTKWTLIKWNKEPRFLLLLDVIWGKRSWWGVKLMEHHRLLAWSQESLHSAKTPGAASRPPKPPTDTSSPVNSPCVIPKELSAAASGSMLDVRSGPVPDRQQLGLRSEKGDHLLISGILFLVFAAANPLSTRPTPIVANKHCHLMLWPNKCKTTELDFHNREEQYFCLSFS